MFQHRLGDPRHALAPLGFDDSISGAKLLIAYWNYLDSLIKNE